MVDLAPYSRNVRTYCGRHCAVLALVGALAGTRNVIHSCSSLSIIVPRSLPSDDPMTGNEIADSARFEVAGRSTSGEWWYRGFDRAALCVDRRVQFAKVINYPGLRRTIRLRNIVARA